MFYGIRIILKFVLRLKLLSTLFLFESKSEQSNELKLCLFIFGFDGIKYNLDRRTILISFSGSLVKFVFNNIVWFFARAACNYS